MANGATLKYYSFFIHFNPFLRGTEWNGIAEKAQTYFLDFLNAYDFGDDVISIRFCFFVEEEIDISKQNDIISTSNYLGIPKSARLTLHFNYEHFIQATDEIQYKITLNGILYLLNYWQNNLKIPKGTPLNEIIENFKDKLIKDKLFENIEHICIKIDNPFRFIFEQHYFYGLREKDILFDTDDIEKHLNNNLYKTDFGKSINQIIFSYDIFDFYNQEHKQYIDSDKLYKYGKDKYLGIMEQYDSNLFEYETKSGQIKYLHEGILKSIKRIGEMKRKPKDFNAEKFYEIMDKLLKEYAEKTI